MFLEVKPEIFPILFPLLCIFVPVIILLIVVLVKKAIKEVKRSRKLKATAGFDYEAYFGDYVSAANTKALLQKILCIKRTSSKRRMCYYSCMCKYF